MLHAAIVFISTVVLILILLPIAPVLGFIDRPGGRKRHEGEVAVIGGIGMFGGYAVGVLLAPYQTQASLPALLSMSMLFAVGITDDRFEVHPWLRLAVHLAAAAILIGSGGVVIERILSWEDGSFIGLDAWAPAFTLLAAMAAINAYNLVDGLDGLAAGLGLLSLVFFLVLSCLAAGPQELIIAIAIAAAPLAAFLAFNAPFSFNRRFRCFMGDAGSTMIGLWVAWFGMRISQGPVMLAQPTTILWMTAVPIMELIVSFARRLADGRSPLSADADHFHHRLQRAGLSGRATCAVLLGITVLFAGCGFLIELFKVDDLISLALLLTCSTATCIALRNPEACKGALLRLRGERYGDTEIHRTRFL
ncbi:UDP-GlcNAc:undecaprenyl-phosphate GlcNAc-1-phosphate transferase [Steroidobacter denitrificans]|uniref:UDP-GlcNAc:undecaprenyl-phosphate GlcNAc-1-phosphate transferase n=1 Tax=Steroidobacter denitrificans TaxID=465721 RepID=A0A127FB96_STEDE|nr:MraY family glycosyltransferase [Steroidobacter denitrificans]AMN46911.1 UDP-GlcNAc:undecaprenyl-phosphate GlcNAc-1-phosphate transferase [Steroidobacter denitrificans]